MRNLPAVVPLLLVGSLLVTPAAPLGGEAVVAAGDTPLTPHPSTVTDLADQSIVLQADDDDDEEGDEEEREDDEDEREEERGDEREDEEDERGDEEDDREDEEDEREDEENEREDGREDDEDEREDEEDEREDEKDEEQNEREDEEDDEDVEVVALPSPLQEIAAETPTSTPTSTETPTTTETSTPTSAQGTTTSPTSRDTSTVTPEATSESTAEPTDAEPAETRPEPTDPPTSSSSPSGTILHTEETPKETQTPTSGQTATVTNVSGLSDWVQTGYNTSVVATVVNRGETPARKALTVTVDGNTVAERTVALQPDERRSVRIEFEATEGTVAVENVTAGQLAVGENYSRESASESRSPAPETDTEPLNWIDALVSLLAITGVGIVLWRSQ